MHITKKTMSEMLSVHKFVIHNSLDNSNKEQLEYAFSLVNIAKHGKYLANNAKIARISLSIIKNRFFLSVKFSKSLDDKILIFLFANTEEKRE